MPFVVRKFTIARPFLYFRRSVATNRLQLVRGADASFEVALRDALNEPLTNEFLTGATATVRVRIDPAGSDVLLFTTDDPVHLSVDVPNSQVIVTFKVADIAALTVGQPYFWQLETAFSNGDIRIPVDWTPVDVSLGGSAVTPPAPFDATIKVDHNFPLSGDLLYLTPGGCGIEYAQVRVYRKSDYDAGNLTSPVGFTTTDKGGQWKQPVLVTPGYSYIVRFEKPYEFGPDIKEIVGV